MFGNSRPVVGVSGARKIRPGTVCFAKTAQQNVPGRIPSRSRLSPGPSTAGFAGLAGNLRG